MEKTGSDSQNNTPSQANDNKAPASGQDFDKLAQQVAKRVWELWREELRHTRERGGIKSGR